MGVKKNRLQASDFRLQEKQKKAAGFRNNR
jgi:hypothetical protein